MLVRTQGIARKTHLHPRTSPLLRVSHMLMLICAFLRRYVIWCAKARYIDRLCSAADLLIEAAGNRLGRCPPDR